MGGDKGLIYREGAGSSWVLYPVEKGVRFTLTSLDAFYLIDWFPLANQYLIVSSSPQLLVAQYQAIKKTGLKIQRLCQSLAKTHCSAGQISTVVNGWENDQVSVIYDNGD